MATPEDSARDLEHARQLHAAGRFHEAEQAFRRLVATGKHREAALEALSDLYLHARRPDQAVAALTTLVLEHPDSFFHTARLAGVLDGFRLTDRAIREYLRLLELRPDLAAAHFNLALLYRKEKRYREAVAAYEKALSLGIDRVQELWSNLGLLYTEMNAPDKAAEMYERALDVDREYVPALFNLAGLFEETGKRQRAIELYERIRALDPEHWESLTRIAYARTAADDDETLLAALRQSIDATKEGDLAREEGLHFALGKLLDDLGRHDEAFEAYRRANEAGARLRNRPYVRGKTEKAFDQLISLFDAEWVSTASTGMSASPVFICGMFRSGSTLVERILAAHPDVTAGGELDFLPWLLARRLSPWPQAAREASPAALQSVAAEYLSRVRELFPDGRRVTDKRPDNFLHLGVIKALFPQAKIVYTKRDPLDNCLSLYFQPLGGNLTYATDPGNAAHYYRQHERLMKHWKSLFADSILTVDYDELVRSPEPAVRRLLAFLDLEWDDRCLQFGQSGGAVRTASLWQVRDGLHGRSSGRSRHYERFIADTRAWLADNPP